MDCSLGTFNIIQNHLFIANTLTKRTYLCDWWIINENVEVIKQDIVNRIKQEADQSASSRKKDHIELAFRSQMEHGQLDKRFYFEPLLAAHSQPLPATQFLGKKMGAPIWVSSMTGGTKEAFTINHNLARACREFGMGMGLGSCRSLLYEDERLPDFDLRSTIGPELPFYANLGIAQVEELIAKDALDLALKLVGNLKADGLIIHVNPFQEWLQPEGDRFQKTSLETIEAFLAVSDVPVIVKEVGQGMGPKSLTALMQLDLAAIDFGASGGTNFSMLELLRSDESKKENYSALTHVGHPAEEMVQFVNQLQIELGDKVKTNSFIISGGVKNFLDGHYHMECLSATSIYGQASGFLKHARGDYRELADYVSAQIEGLALAKAFLPVRK